MARLLRERSRAARPSSRVDRWRLPATTALDGWPPARASGRTEPGLQADSPAAGRARPYVPGTLSRHQPLPSRAQEPDTTGMRYVPGCVAAS